MNACRKVCGPTGFADPGAAGHSPDDPGGAVPVQPLPVRAAEDRPVHALADSQVDCPRVRGASWMVTILPPLRVITRVR